MGSSRTLRCPSGVYSHRWRSAPTVLRTQQEPKFTILALDPNINNYTRGNASAANTAVISRSGKEINFPLTLTLSPIGGEGKK